eukprot:4402025-Prymnesium_polylepis.1
MGQAHIPACAPPGHSALLVLPTRPAERLAPCRLPAYRAVPESAPAHLRTTPYRCPAAGLPPFCTLSRPTGARSAAAFASPKNRRRLAEPPPHRVARGHRVAPHRNRQRRRPGDAHVLRAAQPQRGVEDGADGRSTHRVPQRAAHGTHVRPDGGVRRRVGLGGRVRLRAAEATEVEQGENGRDERTSESAGRTMLVTHALGNAPHLERNLREVLDVSLRQRRLRRSQRAVRRELHGESGFGRVERAEDGAEGERLVAVRPAEEGGDAVQRAQEQQDERMQQLLVEAEELRERDEALLRDHRELRTVAIGRGVEGARLILGHGGGRAAVREEERLKDRRVVVHVFAHVGRRDRRRAPRRGECGRVAHAALQQESRCRHRPAAQDQLPPHADASPALEPQRRRPVLGRWRASLRPLDLDR